MRHSCELDDHVNFGWKEHDGRSFGSEVITDKFHNTKFSISFLKVQSPSFTSREAWNVKINAKPLKSAKRARILSLLFYLGYEGSSMKLKEIETESFKGYTGWTAEVGNFAFGISKSSEKSKEFLNIIYDQVQKSKIWMITQKFSNLMRSKLQQAYYVLGNELFKSDTTKYARLEHGSSISEANLLVYQFLIPNDEEVEFFYFPHDGKNVENQVEIHLKALNKFNEKQVEFNNKIVEKFNLKENSKLVSFVKYAVSNLLGGISYFYGDSEIFSSKGEIERTPEVSLFTDVPARANFPRGFYWDSGFHNILIAKWDTMLSMEILSNWIDKIDKNGWIGREQILGDEARSKVPREYITQNPEYSNPPAPLIPIEMITMKYSQNSIIKSKLKQMYPKLVSHFNWFLKKQRASLFGSPEEEFLFRWRGRSNHHTLTSGLDDYPRGYVPSNFELHVDLLSWMAFASRALSNIKKTLEILDNNNFDEYYQVALRNLNQYHWDESRGCYSDVTVNDDEDGLMFVENVGYVSLFPMLFGLVPVNDPKLEKILDILEDPKQLWTEYKKHFNDQI
jgi:mannosyl-oligosaccharide glucosidase